MSFIWFLHPIELGYDKEVFIQPSFETMELN